MASCRGTIAQYHWGFDGLFLRIANISNGNSPDWNRILAWDST